MATITLAPAIYNNVKQYADKHNISVDEFIVLLINRFTNSEAKKKRFELLPLESLSPELQEIMNIPLQATIDANDINGVEARMEYYMEKYDL